MAMGNAIIAVLGPGTTVVQPPSGPPVLDYNQGSTFRINSSNNRLYYRLHSPRVDNFVTLNSGDLSVMVQQPMQRIRQRIQVQRRRTAQRNRLD
jgi:hypothetical protein